MKYAVIVTLALVGMVVGNPISPLGYGYGYGYGLASPVLPISSSVINHGITVPNVIVTAPIIRPVITPVPVPVVRTPVVLGWSGAGMGWGKGWH